MSRIPVPAIDQAPAASQDALRAVEKALGFAPNLYKVLANSPAALNAALGFNGALGQGALDKRTAGRIALAIANVNGCDYCNAAHTALAAGLRLDAAEIDANRRGRSGDAKADAAVAFAQAVARARGGVSAADVDAVRAAGYGDAELVEIVAHVAFNTFTNYVNEVFKTPIDFPAAPPALRAA